MSPTPKCSIGEIFPLQGTLCRKLQEELAWFCSGAADRAAAAAAAAPAGRGGSDLDNDGGSIDKIVGESGLDGGGATASAAGETCRTRRAAGGEGTERDSSALRVAIEIVRESTGVSAELAAYALLVSKVRHETVLSVFVLGGV